MIGYVLFIALFVFLKDNDCCHEPNTQCNPIVNAPTPFDSPDLVNIEVEPIIIIETFLETFPDTFPEILSEPISEPISETFLEPIPETILEPIPQTLNNTHDFDPPAVYLHDLEHGVLVEAYDLRLSVFPKNTTRVPEENNSITIEMNLNKFIFQIYS